VIIPQDVAALQVLYQMHVRITPLVKHVDSVVRLVQLVGAFSHTVLSELSKQI